MEYLPFGETLVEEHLNSYNSPYKFSALELDSETGNYYASKRYYNPKWSIWLSPDILATEFPDWSPYSYSFQNPVKYTDNTGMAPELADKPLDWYENLITGAYEYYEGSKERDGYRHLGSSTNLAVSNGNEFANYGLNNDGSFSNLDTGAFCHKGESVQTINGTNIVSNLNTTESIKKFASDVAAPFFELPQKIAVPLINQTNIVMNEGPHSGGAYNSENVLIHNTYELNNWRIEPSNRRATATGRPTWQEGKEMIRNTISVTPMGVSTGLGKTPAQEFVINKSVTSAIKTVLKNIIE